MTDSFFIAYCLLFIALFVWACVAEYVEYFVVRFIMWASSFFLSVLASQRLSTLLRSIEK